jgi:hypothetical protein
LPDYRVHAAVTWRFGPIIQAEKPIRATAAKEVGMKNPAEKTTVRPNQNPKPAGLHRALKNHLRRRP